MSRQLGEELSAAVALANLCAGTPNHQHRYVDPPPLNSLLRLRLTQQQFSVPASVPFVPVSADQNGTSKKSKKKKNFAQKLFDILEVGCHSDIITWLPSGRAFIIIDKKRFAKEILPYYFKESQYTSFTRKLSRWKFSRVPRGPYMGAYYHKNFRSGNRISCKLMTCGTSATDDEKKDEKEIDNEDFITAPNRKSPVEAPLNNISPVVTSSRNPPSSTESTKSNNASGKSSNQKTSVESTSRSIQQIKEQLLLIRLQKARVEERKQMLLTMQAEAARLKEIQRLKRAVNLSIQDSESRIRAVVSRVLGRNNNRVHESNSLPFSLRTMQMNNPDTNTNTNLHSHSRAFAA